MSRRNYIWERHEQCIWINWWEPLPRYCCTYSYAITTLIFMNCHREYTCNKCLLSADISDHQDARIVIFDLETTGLSKSAEICQVRHYYRNNYEEKCLWLRFSYHFQIAAVHEDKIFNAYIVPTGAMSSRAAIVTGLQVHGGEMFLNDQQVDTTPPQTAFKNFIAYLRSIGNSIILAAHNGFRWIAENSFYSCSNSKTIIFSKEF